MRFVDDYHRVVKRVYLAIICEFGDFIPVKTVIVDEFIFCFDHDVELGFELLAFFSREIREIVFCIFYINHPCAAVLFYHIGTNI